ncbi:MAG TPA: hypothetical protein VLA44_11910 [Clostridia bacterium]|nr:hypothetical protein [Clostridia bacterium]
MFQLPSRLAEISLQHRHADGTWSTLEPAHHDPAQHDPERDWSQGAIFVCKVCEEEVRVAPRTGTGDDPHDR